MDAAARALPLKIECSLASYLEIGIPESNFKLRIQINVITCLARDAAEGYKKVPKRGLEVGGLLLGHSEPEITVIDDFEPLESEHQRGPSFLLSAADKERLAQTAARRNGEDGRHVVGLYRSHTRAMPAPDDEDCALLDVHGALPSSVLLLLKPAAGRPVMASVYGAGDGLNRRPAEFPCDPAMLTAGGYTVVNGPAAAAPTAAPPPRDPPEPARPEHPPRLATPRMRQALALQLENPAQNQPQPAAQPPAEKRSAGGRNRAFKRLLLWGAVIVVCGSLSGYAVARWWTAPPAPVRQVAPGRSMALRVSWGAGALHLQWDRNAGPIRDANRGVLWIADREQRQLNLTAQELQEGSIEYWPSSSDVSFKLQVFHADNATSESVRAVSIPLPRSEAPPKPESRQQPGAMPSPVHSPPQAEPPAAADAGEHRFARVEMQVVKQSALAKLAGKAPPTRPPTALHRVIPAITPSMRAHLRDEVIVDVRLSLDAAGKIRRADLLTRRTNANQELGDAALGASRRWTFTPARYGERRVASAVVLRYRFGDPELADARGR